MEFLCLSHDGIIDVVCCAGIGFICTRSQFSFEGKDINS